LEYALDGEDAGDKTSTMEICSRIIFGKSPVDDTSNYSCAVNLGLLLGEDVESGLKKHCADALMSE
jgi:hypothetical protein